MTILDIITYPNELLRQKSSSVEIFNEELNNTVDSMVETMYHHSGTVGLAAVQVGILKRITIIDISAKTSKDKLLVLINPVIIDSSKKKYVREGCLSFPEYLADIKRFKKISIKAQNCTGEFFELQSSDLEAVAIQHEIDHFDGILFIDRIDSLKTDLIRRSKDN